MSELLSPRLLARLEMLQMATRRRLAGQLAGEHRSRRHGSSVDFADYRTYHPGDDFRRIDYHLYARLDTLLLKLYEAEDEVRLRLLIDTSASMARGGKLQQAARIAGALGFVALVRRDPVTLHTFPLEGAAPRFVGRNAAPLLFRHLQGLQGSGATPFAAAATHLLARPGPPGLTVVCSDLLTPEWETGLSRLPARGGDVVIVHILASEDLKPDFVGDLELVDAEGAGRVSVSCSPDTVAGYARAAEAWADNVAVRARAAGAAYVRIGSNDDIEPVLLGNWREAGVLR